MIIHLYLLVLLIASRTLCSKKTEKYRIGSSLNVTCKDAVGWNILRIFLNNCDINPVSFYHQGSQCKNDANFTIRPFRICNTTKNEFGLGFRNLTLDNHNDTICCVLSFNDSSSEEVTQITQLVVNAPLTDVQVNASTQIVYLDHGTSYTLECSTTVNYPESVKLLWIKVPDEGFANESQLTDESLNNYGLKRISSTIVYTADIETNQSIVYCRAVKDSSFVDSDPVTIKIGYGPVNVWFYPNLKRVHLNIGGYLSPITCNATCYPRCNASWYQNNSLLENGSNFSHPNFSRNYEGKISCRMTNSITSVSNEESFILIVDSSGPDTFFTMTGWYDIQEKKTFALPCNVTDIMFFANYFRKEKSFGNSVKDRMTWDQFYSTSVIHNVSCLDSGMYVCNSKQNYNEFNVSVSCQPEFYPKLLDSVIDKYFDHGGELKIEVIYVGYPPPNVTWRIKRLDEDKIIPENVSTGYQIITSSNNFIHMSVIKKNMVQSSDQGEYIVTIENTFGKIDAKYRVKAIHSTNVFQNVLIGFGGCFVAILISVIAVLRCRQRRKHRLRDQIAKNEEEVATRSNRVEAADDYRDNILYESTEMHHLATNGTFNGHGLTTERFKNQKELCAKNGLDSHRDCSITHCIDTDLTANESSRGVCLGPSKQYQHRKPVPAPRRSKNKNFNQNGKQLFSNSISHRRHNSDQPEPFKRNTFSNESMNNQTELNHLTATQRAYFSKQQRKDKPIQNFSDCNIDNFGTTDSHFIDSVDIDALQHQKHNNELKRFSKSESNLQDFECSMDTCNPISIIRMHEYENETHEDSSFHFGKTHPIALSNYDINTFCKESVPKTVFDSKKKDDDNKRVLNYLEVAFDNLKDKSLVMFHSLDNRQNYSNNIKSFNAFGFQSETYDYEKDNHTCLATYIGKNKDDDQIQVGSVEQCNSISYEKDLRISMCKKMYQASKGTAFDEKEYLTNDKREVEQRYKDRYKDQKNEKIDQNEKSGDDVQNIDDGIETNKMEEECVKSNANYDDDDNVDYDEEEEEDDEEEEEEDGDDEEEDNGDDDDNSDDDDGDEFNDEEKKEVGQNITNKCLQTVNRHDDDNDN